MRHRLLTRISMYRTIINVSRITDRLMVKVVGLPPQGCLKENYSDGNTLFLNVTERGSKSWLQRVTVDGRRRDIGLGPFPTVSLAEARRRALPTASQAPTATTRWPTRSTRAPHLPRSGPGHVRSEPTALARYQDRAELDAGHGEARLPRDRQDVRRPHPSGGCPANPQASLDSPSRCRAQAPPAHPRDAQVVPGPRLCRTELRRRGHRRAAAAHARRQDASKTAVLQHIGIGETTR